MNRYRLGAWLLGTAGGAGLIAGTLALVRSHKPFYGLAVMFAAVAICEAVDWLRDQAFDAWRGQMDG